MDSFDNKFRVIPITKRPLFVKEVAAQMPPPRLHFFWIQCFSLSSEMKLD